LKSELLNTREFILSAGKMASLKHKLKNFIDYFHEIFIVMKGVASSFWFWIPALFAAGVYISLWAMVAINPLMILILPSILAFYCLYLEEKRIKRRYRLENEKTTK